MQPLSFLFFFFLFYLAPELKTTCRAKERRVKANLHDIELTLLRVVGNEISTETEYMVWHSQEQILTMRGGITEVDG